MFNFQILCHGLGFKFLDISVVSWTLSTRGNLEFFRRGRDISVFIVENVNDLITYSLQNLVDFCCYHCNCSQKYDRVLSTGRVMNGYAGANARRRASLDKQGPTVVHQKPGPLQTIFNLLPDEFVELSYSCVIERSFLYHGRMYVSAWHICFHSNAFSRQMKVIIPIGDIDEIQRSQHAFINPAITIILRMGAGGHGVPPLGSPDGRVRYKFASFWNRNHALRQLQRTAKNYHTMLEAEKKALMVVFLVGVDSFFSFAETFDIRAATLTLGICPDKIHLIRLKRDLDQILDMRRQNQRCVHIWPTISSFPIGSRKARLKIVGENSSHQKPGKLQPYIKEEVLVGICNVRIIFFFFLFFFCLWKILLLFNLNHY
ncbi:hypothetical protein CUMW_084470 [Citrus unshiu]|nr:hypothetical protein CUMW_084470 [Citrus unshiu]